MCALILPTAADSREHQTSLAKHAISNLVCSYQQAMTAVILVTRRRKHYICYHSMQGNDNYVVRMRNPCSLQVGYIM